MTNYEEEYDDENEDDEETGEVGPTKRLPVYLLSDFLGSGKTTLLQKLLEYCQAQGLRLGLLVNDFGAVNVDALLVESAIGTSAGDKKVRLQQLSGGCACCTASRELVIDLLEMTMTYELDLIVVEASGVADPLDLLDQLTTPALLRRMYVAAVVGVVDASRVQNLLKLMPLVERQVRFADVLVLNKCDLLDETGYSQAINALENLNSQARLYPAIYADLDPAQILGDTVSHLKSNDSGHTEHDHAHLPFHTLEYTLEKPLNRARFEQWLEQLPSQVMRAKGFVRFAEDARRPYLLQYVPGQTKITALEPERTLTAQLVFIGLDMPQAELEAGLEICQAR